MTSELSPAAADYLLAFADDEHMIGARHTAWIGMGPFLEEDLAFCSIAQDELGHAVALYEFLTDDVDRFALLRKPQEYRSCAFAELECGDWVDALVRHWLYDRAEQLRWEALSGSANQSISEVAVRAEREESFHRAHAESFMSRISASNDTSSISKLSEAIVRLLPVAQGIWQPSDREEEAIREGFATASSASMAQSWNSMIQEDLLRWGLDIDVSSSTGALGSRTERSQGFERLLASLQEVINIDPATAW